MSTLKTPETNVSTRKKMTSRLPRKIKKKLKKEKSSKEFNNSMNELIKLSLVASL